MENQRLFKRNARAAAGAVLVLATAAGCGPGNQAGPTGDSISQRHFASLEIHSDAHVRYDDKTLDLTDYTNECLAPLGKPVELTDIEAEVSTDPSDDRIGLRLTGLPPFVQNACHKDADGTVWVAVSATDARF